MVILFSTGFKGKKKMWRKKKSIFYVYLADSSRQRAACSGGLGHKYHICMLRRLDRFIKTFNTMASISRSNSPSIHVDEPSAKRIKLSHNISDGVDSNNVSVKDTKRRTLPYSDGLHLAPMVRIGTLPTRLVALEFGAELVWGPEIVDKVSSILLR